jgi:FkbM family methyltransferase
MLKQIEVNGKKLNVNLREKSSDFPVFEEIFLTKIYHKKIPITKEDIWLDLGSNCGYFSLLANCYGAKVFSIEADPRNMEQTNKVLRENDFPINSIQIAVVGEDFKGDHIAFYAPTKISGMWKGSLFKRRDATLIKVKAKRFNELLLETGANCVKMDIEGAEFSILEHSSFDGVERMCFEWSFDKDRSVPRFNAMIKRLGKWFSKIDISNEMPASRDVWAAGPKLNYTLVYCWK